MKVKLLACTQKADAICAAAGNSCYSGRPSADIVEDIDAEKVLSRIVGMGHHSVIEHAVFTFSVEGVSRALTHQLVRHRVASYSQQSQRYVSLDEPTYVTPHTIESDPRASELFARTMDAIWDAYRDLEGMGIPAEDARYLLPNGCTTNITITMNARELLHFFSLRCCNRAQWEIREMADMMMAICMDVSPVIFRDAGPPCVRGPCPEGKLSCGHPGGEPMAEIYLAGGCFWGMEKTMSVLRGVTSTECGYANGDPHYKPDYMLVCSGAFGYREAVRVEYDPSVISLEHILFAFFDVIDPMQERRQGNDWGIQYQTGIYWTDPESERVVREYVSRESAKYPVFFTETGPLTYYWPAEPNHQHYLDKNPSGYCHISPALIERLRKMSETGNWPADNL